jgi:hypothetical protein
LPMPGNGTANATVRSAAQSSRFQKKPTTPFPMGV